MSQQYNYPTLEQQLYELTVNEEKRDALPQPKMKSEYSLYDYQETVLEWMKKKEKSPIDGIRGGLICLKMGLGKTLTALAHIVNRQTNDNEEYPTLVVMSKTLLYEWRNQGVMKFFDNLNALYYHHEFIGRKPYNAMTTENLKRYNIVFTTYDACLTIYKNYSYENTICVKGVGGIHDGKIILTNNRSRPIFRHVQGTNALYEMPWERIICDESQRFANPKTQTFRSMMSIYAKYHWCLTGTPVRNYETDIWAQLRFCGFDKVVNARQWKRHVYTMYRCSQHLYILDYADAKVEMPPKIDKIHNIMMDEKQALVYKTVLKKLENLFATYMADRSISYMCILAMFTRLRQICIAPCLLTSKSQNKEMNAMVDAITEDEEMGTWLSRQSGTAGVGAPKIKKVIELAQSFKANKEKVIIFSMFTSALEIVENALEKAKIPSMTMVGSTNIKERLDAMQIFKETDSCNVLLVHYKVGGEGINLIEATHVIPLEPWWTHAVHNQAIFRSWRRGQTKAVTVHWLLILESIEARVLDLCTSKQAMSDAYLGYDSGVTEKTGLGMWGMQQLLRTGD